MPPYPHTRHPLPRARALCAAFTACITAGGVALLLLSTPASLWGQSRLLGIPLDDPAYEQLDGLVRQGCVAADVSSFRPYSFGAVRDAVRSFTGDGRCDGAIAEALHRRFLPDTVPERREVDSTVAPLVTTEGVVYEPGPERPSPWRIGGLVSLRATALQKGEFRPRWVDVRPTDEGDPPLLGVAQGRIAWEGGPSIAAVVDLEAQSHVRNDPHFRTARLRSTTGGVQFAEAYLVGRVGRFSISFGRQSESWLGDGEDSFLLSAHGPALDRLAIGLHYRRFEARALAALVDDVELTTEVDGIPIEDSPRRLHRFLVGHALTWRPNRRFRLSVGETALLSRTSPVLDLAYANPLMAYLVTQDDRSIQETERQDNILIFVSATARIAGGALDAGFLVDDIQIDAADRKITPDQLGWSVKFSHPIPLVVPTSVAVAYRRSDSFTYLREFYGAVYQHYDAPIGSELGPDADELLGELDVWFGGTTRVFGALGWWRRGAQRLTRRPAEGAGGRAGEPFPTVEPDRPRVQRALRSQIGLQLLRPRFPVSIQIESAHIDNANNQAVNAAIYLRAQLIATYVFRYP